MEKKLKFTFGDKVCVIKDYKVKEFEIKSIILGKDEVRYSEDVPGLLCLDSYSEDQCFASREELCNYILGNE